MMAPRTLMSSLLLLAVSMWGWGAPTRLRLASREACMRLCWYNQLCESLRWNTVTGDCDVSPTQLNTSQSGMITITAASLQDHWEFPSSSHPCANRPCVKGDLCVPVEKATKHICLRTANGLPPLTADVTGYNTTTPNSTECIPVPQSCLDFLNATKGTQQDLTAISECNVTCDMVDGDFAICHFKMSFIKCSNGIGHIIPCAATTVFNGTTGNCEDAK